MTVWRVPPVSEQPWVSLLRWQVYEIETGARHFVGYHPRAREGRVSSTVVEFDAESRCGKTRSGRIYELVGLPGFDRDAGYVWLVWQSARDVLSVRDVTSEYSDGEQT